ncbi:MAG TPA: sodium:sulfate symporter [Gammaproteobacteria bacterium]|nr:sodium:sulfate symporter [Gammaproteobacteria bacterium]
MAGALVHQFLSPDLVPVAVLAVICIGFWATVVVPDYWTALAFFLVAVVFELAPSSTVFSGFHTSTWWLMFGGMILGASMTFTGLGKRAAQLLSRMLGRRYQAMIAGLVGFGLLLAFIMPSSMGRIVLLMPIILALAEHRGYVPGSRGQIGMLLAAAFGTFLPAFTILPANAPNMILAGMAEALYDQPLIYWDYLLLHFPLLGLLKAGVIIVAIVWLFPDSDPQINEPEQGPMGALSAAERRLIVVLALCLGAWLTDALHHISPGWIALAGGLYCLWPVSGLTDKRCINDLNYGSLIFIAGIFGLGALLSDSGLGSAVVQALGDRVGFSPEHPEWNVIALTLISTFVAMVTNLPGVPAVLTPMAEHLSQITGLSLQTVLMTQVIAFSNVFLPYQAPPLLLAMQLGALPLHAVTKLCLTLFAIGACVLIPLDLLWWQVLGWL